MTLRDRLEELAHAGWTDLELARAIGVSRPTITRWRTGEVEPHAGMLRMVFREIAKLLAKA